MVHLRKHIQKSPNGYVITEFLPKVYWAGKYNTIACAASLHFYEGRWLKSNKYLNSYANFGLQKEILECIVSGQPTHLWNILK
jgi:hypothetical protein